MNEQNRRGLSPESQELVEQIRERLLELKSQRELDRHAPFATAIQRLTAIIGIETVEIALEAIDRTVSAFSEMPTVLIEGSAPVSNNRKEEK